MRQEKTHKLVEERATTTSVDNVAVQGYDLFSVSDPRVKPITIKVLVDQKKLVMEVDTGASMSLMSEEAYKRHWNGEDPPQLKHTDVRLRTYTGEAVQV